VDERAVHKKLRVPLTKTRNLSSLLNLLNPFLLLLLLLQEAQEEKRQ
jgi:hypothetical protein